MPSLTDIEKLVLDHGGVIFWIDGLPDGAMHSARDLKIGDMSRALNLRKDVFHRMQTDCVRTVASKLPPSLIIHCETVTTIELPNFIVARLIGLRGVRIMNCICYADEFVFAAHLAIHKRGST
jgi:hypothetical protein